MYHREMIRKRNAFNYLRNAAEYRRTKRLRNTMGFAANKWTLRRIMELAQLGNNLMAVPSMTNCVKITGYNQN